MYSEQNTKTSTNNQDKNDLSKSSYSSVNEIVHTIEACHNTDNMYKKIGDRVLTFVHPTKNLDKIYSSQKLDMYTDEYKDYSKLEEDLLAPHIYQLGANVYFHLRRSGLDQAIMLLGDISSGKTSSKMHIIDVIANIRSSSRKEKKLYSQVVAVNNVLQCFGCANTKDSRNSSRYGLYTELQFDDRGRTVGVKNLEYCLEKNRVVKTTTNEGNFNVFYQLLNGTNNEEKSFFKIDNIKNFTYLSQTKSGFSDKEMEAQFRKLREDLKLLGFNVKYQSQIFQLLACILHLGNINFINSNNNIPNKEPSEIKNKDELALAADFLGVSQDALENMLVYKTKLIKKEMCTMFLDANSAKIQRDSFAKCLYSLLFSWIVEYINMRLCKDSISNFIGILDLPGTTTNINPNYSFEQFCYNYSNERLFDYMNFQVFEASQDAYLTDGIQVPVVEYQDNTEILDLFGKQNNGLIYIMEKQANKLRGPIDDTGLLQVFNKIHGDSEYYESSPSNLEFTIKHFNGNVVYTSEGFMEKNMDIISSDFVHILSGKSDISVSNSFVSGLFNSKAVNTEVDPRNGKSIVAAQQSSVPTRRPSTKKGSKDQEKATKTNINCISSQFKTALDELFNAFDSTENWFVLCIKASDGTSNSYGSRFDHIYITSQIRRYNLLAIVERKNIEYTICYRHDEFSARYQQILEPLDPEFLSLHPQQICHNASVIYKWDETKAAIGDTYIYLNDSAWKDLENNLRSIENEGRPINKQFGASQSFNMDNGSIFTENVEQRSVFGSDLKSSLSFDNDMLLNTNVNEKQIDEYEEQEAVPKTLVRKLWVGFVWICTFWIPSCLLSLIGRMKLKETRMAWREKFTLCFLIILANALLMCFIIGLSKFVCPTRDIFTQFELSDSSFLNSRPYVYIHGVVYDLNKLSSLSGNHPESRMYQIIKKYKGQDLSPMFPQPVSELCQSYDGSDIDPSISFYPKLDSKNSDPNYDYHDHRYYRQDEGKYKEGFYANSIQAMNIKMKKGDIAKDPKTILKDAQNNKKIVIINDNLYDLTKYVNNDIYALYPGDSSSDSADKKFLDTNFINEVIANNGKDITNRFNAIYSKDPSVKSRTIRCLNNLFYAGKVDDRNSTRCLFAAYFPLALTAFMFGIILAKFLASLNFGSVPEPEDHDQFVILTVPCYTEGEESLRKTIDSLATLKYDDKRKLLLIIADGMVVGSGNDDPTPRIVLDILGADSNTDPEPLSFLSLGEGIKQHNMGKVYTGLYECNGHVVPYMVIVKVGRPTERNRPGNRGKRDSQLILMRFFNKVHYDHPMNPLELEMYHQIKNVVGVDPKLYEYVLMVDADTFVMKDSLNRMISSMLHDSKIMGLCGETALSNENDSITTMIQVYEYFISHYLAKSFESLFGSVTCLPGCFSMYRIRSPTNVPLLANNMIINDYAENTVDTLHKKNLLHLGEDRYLTTLLLKHFPLYKMTFVPDAKCLTNAPDTWKVLLSQRRRWINSTIHNFFELIFLPRLCGFCCFSMRFIVFIDLFSTMVLPAALAYLGYFIYLVIESPNSVTGISIAFIVAPYVLQVLVFLFRRQWQHVGWLIIYLISLPAFSMIIPIYSFWHFDDFSWGKTHVVIDNSGKKKLKAVDEVKFDPRSIPLKKWSEYEEEMLNTNEGISEYTQKHIANNVSKIHNVMSERSLVSTSSQQGINLINSNMPFGNSNPSYNNSIRQISNRGYPVNNITSNSRPSSQHFDNSEQYQIPRSNEKYNPNSKQINEYAIVEEIQYILSNSDLMNITKKQVREQLAAKFETDMTPYKDFINSSIENILSQI